MIGYLYQEDHAVFIMPICPHLHVDIIILVGCKSVTIAIDTADP